MSDNQLRETILRFYALMTDRSYEETMDEYLGKSKPGAGKHQMISNKLYMAVEYSIARYRLEKDNK